MYKRQIKECAGELKLQNLKSRQKKEKSREKAAPASDQPRSAFTSRGTLIEKLLYTILALLIVTWVAVAVNHYYPQYFSFTKTPTPELTTPASLPVDDNQIEPGEQTSIPEQIEPVKSTRKQSPGITASKNHSPVQPASNDNPKQFQIPDPNTVIRIEFGRNNELGPDGIETLDNLSAVLHNHLHLEVVIKGYSKGQGSYRYNKKMSEFTANIVKGYLVGKGVSSQRVEAMGMWVVHSDSQVQAPETTKSTQWVDIQFKNS